jgi:DNA repair exonuclease SbcCD ATPase subunit
MSKSKKTAFEIVQEAAGTEVVEFRPFDVQLADYKARYLNVVYDMHDKKQEKQARSDRLAIGKVVAELDRVHAAVKAPLLEQVKVLDGERKRIKDDLQSVQGGIKKQIEEHEAALQAIEDDLEARVREISNLVLFPGKPTSIDVFDRIMELGIIVVDETFSHRQADAVIEHQRVGEILDKLHEDICQQEAAAAELERLREEARKREQEDRDREIAAAAVENERKLRDEKERQQRELQERAVREAERAAEIAQETARKAEERAAQAEREATLKAERDQAAKLEQERVERERREANELHRSEIRIAALTVLSGMFLIEDETLSDLFDAIDAGKIPHVKIEY